jgi:hypothetical protein
MQTTALTLTQAFKRTGVQDWVVGFLEEEALELAFGQTRVRSTQHKPRKPVASSLIYFRRLLVLQQEFCALVPRGKPCLCAKESGKPSTDYRAGCEGRAEGCDLGRHRPVCPPLKGLRCNAAGFLTPAWALHVSL